MHRFTQNFYIYLLANLLWSLGLMTFFLVYNLHLLDLGFKEKFIGQITACTTLGSLAASVPSGLLLNRFGTHQVIRATVLCTAIFLATRSYAESPTLLLLFACLSGVSIGAWMVAAPPFLAGNTRPEHRSRAFSLNYGGSIGMGALAGILAGQPPEWLSTKWFPAISQRHLLLLMAVLLVSLALVVLSLLTSRGSAPLEQHKSVAVSQSGGKELAKVTGQVWRSWPPTEDPRLRYFLLKLIVTIALWSFFVGSFPPFFNVFFVRKHEQSLPGIGLIFSLSQLCQALAILSVPWIATRLGRVRTIGFLQLSATLFLAPLVVIEPVQLAGLVYLIYVSCQAMCEPVLENFLMDSVEVRHRNLVSSVRYATLFTVQAPAVWLAGSVIERFGYSTLLIALTCAGILAAGSFYFFFHSASGSGQTSLTTPQTG
jgi:MFS family permease